MRWVSLFMISVGVAAAVSGCSTLRTYKSARSGLFDRLHEKSTPGLVGAKLAGAKGTVLVTHARLGWPLAKVEVTSAYGERDGSIHEGIDFKAADGTPVFAAESGKVLYAGSRISGYGRMIVIRHTGKAKGLSTIYAHNSRLLVRVDQSVRKGQKIALSGHSGRARGPHVHFEVRQGSTPVDPMLALGNSALKTPVFAKKTEVNRKIARAR